MTTDDKECSIRIVAWLSSLVVILSLLVCWIAYSHFEAVSCNKMTGADVSTWDAIFLSLAVQSNPATNYQIRKIGTDSVDKPQRADGQVLTDQFREREREEASQIAAVV
jgi:hypothetical protein